MRPFEHRFFDGSRQVQLGESTLLIVPENGNEQALAPGSSPGNLRLRLAEQQARDVRPVP